MARIGFCGPTYQSESLNADAQRSINLYPEFVESQQGRTSIAMYQRPGLVLDQALAGESSVPALFSQNGRMFAAGVFLWERFSNGMWTKRGNLNPASAGPGTISITANQNQLLACSNGNLYLMDLTTNLVSPVNMAQFNGPIAWVAFCDSFFLAFQQNSQTFYTSNALDGTTWLAVNAEQISLITDNIIAMIVSHRDVWLQGNKSSIVYGNSGAALAPFIPIAGAFVEQGSAALAGAARADNSIFWLGQDERGALVGWRANAYTPQRVSNHAVENAWSKYAIVSDAVSYSCQFNGHIFWVIFFQNANATWVYDVATNMWHEWDFSDPVVGQTAHRSCSHCFAFNQHFVGDWNGGNVFQMSLTFNDDFGNPIKRLRRSPTVSKELEWQLHQEFTLDVETGVGPIPPLAGNAPPTSFILMSGNAQLWSMGVTPAGLLTTIAVAGGTVRPLILNDNAAGLTSWQVGVNNTGNLTTTSIPFVAGSPNNLKMVASDGSHVWLLEVTATGLLQTIANGVVGRDPVVFLRWSDDSGHTWSSSYARSLGGGGVFKTRVIWRRLGRTRQRVYEVLCSDPVPFRIVDAYVKASPDFAPQERIVHQYRKGA